MEVERLSEDRLSREVWRFGVDYYPSYITLYCRYFGRETRPSSRHKFKPDPARRWDSHDPRRYWSGLKEDDVPLPDDVIDEALKFIVIRVRGATGELVR
jgi:hypothetical protein